MRIMHIVTCLFIALAAWSQYQLCDCQHAVAAAENPPSCHGPAVLSQSAVEHQDLALTHTCACRHVPASLDLVQAASVEHNVTAPVLATAPYLKQRFADPAGLANHRVEYRATPPPTWLTPSLERLAVFRI